jgi:hypothetical protein
MAKTIFERKPQDGRKVKMSIRTFARANNEEVEAKENGYLS